MRLTVNDYSAAITFITGYRKMETGSIASNKALLKKVLKPYDFKHLYNSWMGRDKNFGSFFLNLSYENQGLIITNWQIEIPGFTEYLKQIEDDPSEAFFMNPPVEISKLHELVKFFFNNGIGDNPAISQIRLPVYGERFGNSTNWSKYIISLNQGHRMIILNEMYTLFEANIKQSADNKQFLKGAAGRS